MEMGLVCDWRHLGYIVPNIFAFLRTLRSYGVEYSTLHSTGRIDWHFWSDKDGRIGMGYVSGLLILFW
jgi:hypothetical protein